MDMLSGAKESAGNIHAVYKGNKKSLERTYLAGVQVAQKKYPDMTPSKIENEYHGVKLSKEVRDYEKIRDNATTEYRKRFKVSRSPLWQTVKDLIGKK